MDDFQVVLYIVFGVIYVLSRILKKNKQKKSPSRPQPTGQEIETEVEEPVSFEDLLKEITGTKVDKPKPAPRQEPSPNENPYQIHETTKSQSEFEMLNERMGAGGIEAKPLVEAKPIQEVQSIHTHDHSKHKGFIRFGAFGIEEDEDSEFMTYMHEEDGARKAFILSEIFNRKY